jgi:hypothetical protein
MASQPPQDNGTNENGRVIALTRPRSSESDQGTWQRASQIAVIGLFVFGPISTNPQNEMAQL